MLHALRHRRLRNGMLAIFCYVGAEVAIGSLIISFLELENVMGMAHNEAKGRLRNDDCGQEFIENEPLVDLTGQARAAENSIRLLRKRRSALIREGKPGWRQEVRALNEQIGERMKTLNKSVQAVESAR